MDVVQDIFKPVAEVHAGCLAASHEGIDDRRIFRRAVMVIERWLVSEAEPSRNIAAKQKVAFSRGDESHTVLNQVIIFFVSSVKQITLQSDPVA